MSNPYNFERNSEPYFVNIPDTEYRELCAARDALGAALEAKAALESAWRRVRAVVVETKDGGGALDPTTLLAMMDARVTPPPAAVL